MTELRRLRLPAELTNLNDFRDVVEEVCQYLRIDENTAYGLTLAVDECIANAILHGYKGQGGEIELTVELVNHQLRMTIHDDAPHFDPTTIPIPDINKPLEDRPIGGLGMFLVRKNTDEIFYRALPNQGNELVLVKHMTPDRE